MRTAAFSSLAGNEPRTGGVRPPMWENRVGLVCVAGAFVFAGVSVWRSFYDSFDPVDGLGALRQGQTLLVRDRIEVISWSATTTAGAGFPPDNYTADGLPGDPEISGPRRE